MVTKVKINVEVTVKLTLPTMDLILTREDAVSLRDVLNNEFPPVHLAQPLWANNQRPSSPGIRKIPMFKSSHCGGFGVELLQEKSEALI